MSEARVLAFRVRPLEWETFESWIEAMSARHHCSIGAMATALGLIIGPEDGRAVTSNRAYHPWAIRLTDQDALAIERATRLPAETFHRMTRSQFTPQPTCNTLSGTRPPRSPVRMDGGGFCSKCLEEFGGRWDRVWQFRVGFVCTRHARVLADACPVCGRGPRQRSHPIAVVPKPGHCHNPAVGHMDGRGSTRCGADLTQVPLREATDAMVIAQAGLTKLVTEGQAHFGIYAERPQTAEPVLHDIRLVGRAAGKALEIAGRGQAVIGDELAAAYMKARKQTETSKDVDRRLRSGVESALGYLALCDPEDVMSLARDFIPAATPYGSHTPELQRLLVAAGGVHRQRTAYLQRRRTVNATNPEDRARRVPARLWSEWAERLNPRPGSTPEHAAETLSVAILAAGVGSPTSQVAPLLGRDTPGAKQLSYLLQGLRRGEHAGERILHAIGECAEYLDTHASPIDYARRRKLDYSNLLPATAWQGVCEAAGVSPGGERTRLIAFAHLFRTLTGSPTRWAWSFEQARGYMTPLVVDAFASTLPPEVQAALDEIGASFLSSNGVNEPLTWTPSLDPVRDLEPPAKTGLGEERTRTRGVAPRAWNPSRPMRGVLDTESIAQQYARGVTTYELAKSANVSRQTISRTLRDAGEESRKGRRATFAIGPDWLRQKYITEQRTIPQIAEEVGCTPMTINRLLHEHQIPVRPRGSGSEARSLRPDDAAGDSTLLQHVLVGRTGVQSAHRFLTVARHGTIGEAATEIGVKGSSLSVQMSKLAERAGGPLINHAERGRPLTLTPLGQQLAKELRERYPDGT